MFFLYMVHTKDNGIYHIVTVQYWPSSIHKCINFKKFLNVFLKINGMSCMYFKICLEFILFYVSRLV